MALLIETLVNGPSRDALPSSKESTKVTLENALFHVSIKNIIDEQEQLSTLYSENFILYTEYYYILPILFKVLSRVPAWHHKAGLAVTTTHESNI